jgi:hypothetical protein
MEEVRYVDLPCRLAYIEKVKWGDESSAAHLTFTISMP